MEDKEKNFMQGLLITFGVIILGLVSYIYYTSHILTQKEAPRCEYKGWAYADKEVFDMGDDCNVCFCHSGETICSKKNCSNSGLQTVQISTDKKGYRQGEKINITLLNNTLTSVYYNTQNNVFWKLEKQENGNWVSIRDTSSLSNSQVIINSENIRVGDPCTIILEQQTGLNELKIQQGVQSQFSQLICKADSGLTTGKVEILPVGQYRFTLTYGDKTEGKPDVLSNAKTVYSDPFTIK